APVAPPSPSRAPPAAPCAGVPACRESLRCRGRPAGPGGRPSRRGCSRGRGCLPWRQCSRPRAARPGFALGLAAMTSLERLRRWLDRIDRERIRSFVRFLWSRFLDDRCFETAGALSYTSLFAMVPLAMVVFGVLSAFPVFEDWTDRLSGFVFSNFVPSSARVVEDYLRGFALGARRLTVPGIIALMASALLAMWSVESTFNRIWRV